jgi:GT2 family glycosyltransferase
MLMIASADFERAPATTTEAASVDDTATAPRLSVVIASVNGPDYLEACLEALGRQRGGIDAEVVVADCCGPAVAERIARTYPHVRLHSFAERLTVPQLRAFAINASRGDVVVMTEDHCVPTEDWYQRILEAHERLPHLAIGGTIDNAATERLVDWAVFLCEYSEFVSPMRAGVVAALPGPNVSYKRAAIPLMQGLLDEGHWENVLHGRLQERGFPLYLEPSIRVLHRKFFGLGEFLSQRYHYGRGFAGVRVQGAPAAKKAVFAAGAAALPPLILSRIARRLFGRARHRVIYLKSLPLLVLFTLSWTLGEMVGYVSGPGDSLSKVE